MKMRTLAGAAALVLGAACGGDAANGNVTLGVMSAATGASAALTATPAAGSLALSDGTHTLTLTSVDVILAEIRVESHDHHGACDGSGEHDGCERVDAGPMFVSLALDGTVHQQITLTLPAGTYDRIKFRIDDLEDDTSDIIAAHPEMADASIRAVGTFDGTDFTFTSALDAEQEVNLTAPLVVADGGPGAGVTLSIDVSQWFTEASGQLIDPTDARNDSAISNAIANNLDTSFGCFGDDDQDGQDNDHDGHDDRGADDAGGHDSGDDHSGSDGGTTG